MMCSQLPGETRGYYNFLSTGFAASEPGINLFLASYTGSNERAGGDGTEAEGDV